jgi:hypothetical protein
MAALGCTNREKKGAGGSVRPLLQHNDGMASAVARQTDLEARMTMTRLAAAVACASLLAGCATTRMDAQWSNPDYAGRTLKGASVLVACEAQDATLQRICEDRLAAEVSSRGGKPTLNSQLRETAMPPAGVTDPYVAAARRIGAGAIVRTTLQAGLPMATGGGPTIGLGIGGGSGRVGIGGGVALPIGGTRVSQAYTSETALIDPANGAIIWSGRASSSTAQDVTGQIGELTSTTLQAVQRAGFL